MDQAERRAALVMLQASLPGTRRITVPGVKGNDTQHRQKSFRALTLPSLRAVIVAVKIAQFMLICRKFAKRFRGASTQK
jgi:hypothetical protein